MFISGHLIVPEYGADDVAAGEPAEEEAEGLTLVALKR